jgi:hypothetical protein
MVHDSGADHIVIDINDASCQVFAAFNGSGMITIFPKCSFSIFSLIVFLPGSSCDQLDRSKNIIPVSGIVDE